MIVGLGMLYFSSFAKIQYTGPAIALSLAVALVAALTLAPILLSWLRGAIFWPFKPPHHVTGADPERESLEQIPHDRVLAQGGRPGGQVPARDPVVCLAGLIPLAVIGAQTKANYSQLADLDPDRPSVIGASVIRRYFAVGELSPTMALVAAPAARFPVAGGPRRPSHEVSRRLVAHPGRRRGPLALPAAGQAADPRRREDVPPAPGRPGDACGGRLAVRQHQAGRTGPT